MKNPYSRPELHPRLPSGGVFPWRLTPFKTNISDVEYQVTEKGRAASVDNA